MKEYIDRWIKAVESLSQFFQEDNGRNSLVRLLTAYTVYTIMSTWRELCIKEGKLIPLDLTQVLSLLGVIGLKVTQKAWEKGGSNGNLEK